jgi:hypothetical protein
MRHFDEPWAALGRVCAVARCRLVGSDTFHAMGADGVMPSRHLLRHDCRHAMRIAHKRPWYVHNAELSAVTQGVATRRGTAPRCERGTRASPRTYGGTVL